MTQDEINVLAHALVEYWILPHSSPKWKESGWATEVVFDLTYSRPDDLWRLILAVHRLDQSIETQQRLSAGPIEDLLAKHGEKFITLAETEARRDPSFAKVLGGVWRNSMSDDVWKRVQAIWDRRGWDGIPD